MDIRLDEINHWIQNDLGINNPTIEPASADASFRRYFRVSANGESTIVMDAPPDKENCDPFIDITNRLLKSGVNSPEVVAYLPEKGFLMLSDLGSIMYLDKLTEDNADQLYQAAIDSLVTMQTRTSTANLTEYNDQLLHQEMTLFSDWLVEKHLSLSVDQEPDNKWLTQTFSFLARSALDQPQVFVHRDYHSRNLTWQADQPPGILDFQDAVLGPISYDLVSLLRDCYIQWPQDRVVAWLKYYCERIKQKDASINFSDAEFIRWFDLMGVQRHLKASGIFARLWHRDGKQGYLKDIPRTLNYIVEISRKYPELKDLHNFLIHKLLPALAGGSD